MEEPKGVYYVWWSYQRKFETGNQNYYRFVYRSDLGEQSGELMDRGQFQHLRAHTEIPMWEDEGKSVNLIPKPTVTTGHELDSEVHGTEEVLKRLKAIKKAKKNA